MPVEKVRIVPEGTEPGPHKGDGQKSEEETFHNIVIVEGVRRRPKVMWCADLECLCPAR